MNTLPFKPKQTQTLDYKLITRHLAECAKTAADAEQTETFLVLGALAKAREAGREHELADLASRFLLDNGLTSPLMVDAR